MNDAYWRVPPAHLAAVTTTGRHTAGPRGYLLPMLVLLVVAVPLVLLGVLLGLDKLEEGLRPPAPQRRAGDRARSTARGGVPQDG